MHLFKGMGMGWHEVGCRHPKEIFHVLVPRVDFNNLTRGTRAL